MTTTLIPIVCAIVAALVALALTPLAARVARRLGAVDAPSDRRIHTVATPRLGGLAIVVGFMVPALPPAPPAPATSPASRPTTAGSD